MKPPTRTGGNIARAIRLIGAATAIATSQALAEPIKPIPLKHEADLKKAAIGAQLFHDRKLSRDNTISCASCHILAEGGDDNRRVSTGIENRQGGINSPTVFNVAMNFKQFWDGRATTLHQQIDGPVQADIEMGSLWPEVIAKLYRDGGYTEQFKAAFGEGISRNTIREALTEFMRTLSTPNSRFDQWLRGRRERDDRT